MTENDMAQSSNQALNAQVLSDQALNDKKLSRERLSDKALWGTLRQQANDIASQEKLLAPWLSNLFEKDTATSLAMILAAKLGNKRISSKVLIDILTPIFNSDWPTNIEGINVSDSFKPSTVSDAIKHDLLAANQRDPACTQLINIFLFSKGYHALCCYRAMHWLWNHDQPSLAHYIQSRVSKVFAIDIHPESVIGKGVFLDHGSGIVIGATAVVEDNVSIMQQVTLGGTGKDREDRHPKIRSHVLIGAGAQILGNIVIHEKALVAPASVVLKAVPGCTYVAGVPAKPIGERHDFFPALTMQHFNSPN